MYCIIEILNKQTVHTGEVYEENQNVLKIMYSLIG